MRFSTSGADSPGALVITSTWLGVKSGNASTLTVANAHIPPPTSNRTPPMTAALKRSAIEMIRLIITTSPCRACFLFPFELFRRMPQPLRRGHLVSILEAPVVMHLLMRLVKPPSYRSDLHRSGVADKRTRPFF